MVTSLIAWIGIDSRGPTSFYLASDSRITWLNSESRQSWDFARKVWAPSSHLDLIGYYGDVLFTSQIIGQIAELMDKGGLFESTATPVSKFAALASAVRESHASYPSLHARQGNFSVVHCSRSDRGIASSYNLFELAWSPQSAWHETRIVPDQTHSGIVKIGVEGPNRSQNG